MNEQQGEEQVQTRGIVPPSQAETMARMFHDIYERLAPEYGYETRPETREFDRQTPNGRLMIATCAAMLVEMERQVKESPLVAVHNEDAVKWLAGKVSEIASGQLGGVHAVGLILANTEVQPSAIGFMTHRIDPESASRVFTALLAQAEEAARRKRGGIILPGH